jgi:hypothetical protein
VLSVISASIQNQEIFTQTGIVNRN